MQEPDGSVPTHETIERHSSDHRAHRARTPRIRHRHVQFLLFLGMFVVLCAALAPIMPAHRAVLIAFDVSALLFCILTFREASRLKPARMRAAAADDDASRGLLLLIAGLVLAVILVSVVTETAYRGQMHLAEVGLVLATLVLAWLFGNLVAARHYARLFYDPRVPEHPRLIFPCTADPDLWDFIYFALVIGMTFQVSDVQIASRRFRHAALLHAAIAFFFNIGVLALTVNVIANAT